MKKVKECVKEKIDNIIENGIEIDNLDLLYKLVDIHKDIENEEYWKCKEEVMCMNYRDYGREYGNYGNYGREDYGRRMRDSRGRYMERGNYGRRYRGDDMMDQMHEHYGRYQENKEMYGTDANTMKSLEYMLQSVEDFMMMLKEEAGSQEEVEMIQRTARKISEM